MDQSHPDIVCDVCEAVPIIGLRVTCLICENYDLCELCYRKKRFSKNHRSYHPVQTLLPPDEFERSLEGLDQDEIRIFRCPCCGDDDFNVRELTRHCFKYHGCEHYPVRCPICVSRGWPSEYTKELLEHIKSWHSDEDGFDQSGSNASSNNEGDWEDIESEDDQCCICQESIPTEDCRKLPCEHTYHRACINRWLFDNNNCPQCRAVMCYDDNL